MSYEESKMNPRKEFSLLVIASILLIVGYVLTFSVIFVGPIVDVPGEQVHSSYIGDANAVSTPNGEKDVTIELGEEVSSAEGNIEVYYTNSLGVSSNGLGGGGSSSALESKLIDFKLTSENPTKQITIEGDYTVALLKTSIEEKTKSRYVYIKSIIGIIMFILSIIIFFTYINRISLSNL